MQMFEKELTHSGHTTKFSVTEGGEGWEVRVEEDSRLIRRACYTDWHRVERAVSKMTLEVSALEESGWRSRRTRGHCGRLIRRTGSRGRRRFRSAGRPCRAWRAGGRRARRPTAFRYTGRIPTPVRAGGRARSRGSGSRPGNAAARTHAASGGPPRRRRRSRPRRSLRSGASPL